MKPNFVVPAEYFYALGVNMPPEVTPQERYRMACLQDERSVLNQINKAIEANVISNNPAGMNPHQAARRLRSLSAIGTSLPKCLVSDSNTDPLHQLIQGWLNEPDEDISVFWKSLTTDSDKTAHLDLVLCAITNNDANLIAAIKAIPITTVDALAARTKKNWEDFFTARPDLLPSFTAPETVDERIDAFVRYLQRFFDVTSGSNPPELDSVDGSPLLGRSLSDPLQRFVDSYKSFSGVDFAFGTTWDETHFNNALNDIFPNDSSARAWLEQVLHTIDKLYRLTDIGQTELHFSLMEALYARGFTGRESIVGLSLEAFQASLTGTVAYEHAPQIYENADVGSPSETGNGHRFQPINPDGSLTNCIPPLYLSPLGPVAYLHEMLRVSKESTYETSLPTDVAELKDILAERRGSLGDLLVTQANLETPIPLTDIVNECLEAIAATGSANGVVYNTASEELAGHKLKPADSHAEANEEPFHHDPVTLFAALPEHSSPATPVKQPSAYAKLKQDFSSPVLPYSQSLDISRSYLRQLRTSRYAVMRRFRKEITEFVLDPNNEPAEFQRHLWRYPVRIDIAIEYLGITPEEYDLLFTHEIAIEAATEGRLLLRELYEFDADTVNNQSWTQIVIKVSEFLERTGLTYCEFLDLWQSKFVEFRRVGEHPEFSTCEPCYLDKLVIQFEQPREAIEALKRLIVFIRLWHKLQQVEGAKYSFWQLRDICQVLQLFQEGGSINPDFIRQLAAFQILRDHLSLRLTDGSITSGTGGDRTHLLALWVGASHSKWNWAVDHLLDRMQHYALARHHCDCRPPEFIKLLVENLDPLSRLAGFDPNSTADTWHAHPTHTLRFVEILAKIYASDFGVGDIIFLFTVDDHLEGDDPFPLQPKNEALCSPLGLPDDEDEYSLWNLRDKLLAVNICEEEAEAWTWTQIEATLREEFGFILSGSSLDPLLSFAEHFFPSILEDCGCPVELQKRQYRVDLASGITSVAMWNTPIDGPFHYDSANQKLWTQLPLTDEAVLAKISRIRPLKPEEQQAVQDLYFLPRVDLAQFAFIFPNFAEADEHLIQEADETKRWAYFQRAFTTCYAQCQVIAEHLAEHVVKVTGKPTDEGIGLAWRLLKHLFADENKAKTPWEDDTGVPPEVTWSQPNGGAFAALLGLTGTGLLGEFASTPGLVWRELRGPMDAFSPTRNAWNAPVPTVLPSMNLTLTPQQEKFVGIRNGFALANGDGKRLGGAQAFAVRWRGVLLVETEGAHGFWAGAPTPDGEEPDFLAAKECQWRVMLRRGQKTWVLLSHQWPDEEAPATCSSPLSLKRGTYDLIVEFVQRAPTFKDADELCPQTTGFQVKYAGPDTCDRLIAIPFNRLFQDWSDRTFDDQINDDQVNSDGQSVPIDGEAKRFLRSLCRSSLRDIRRTYQRTFKALLFAHQFELSAKPISDSGQSEIGYMLAHADDFAGVAYYRAGRGYTAHRMYFDFNLLPLNDNYYPPQPTDDLRVQPSAKRQQALFDWWERIFDYTILRREAQLSPERPIWFLFHEAAENHPDDPAHLLRHMGVDLSHAAIDRMYALALHTARQAQRAFNYERGYTARSFVPTDAWDTLRDGLLAGDRLHLSLRQMEKAYLDENLREYELTKHFSLRLHFPLAFLQLKVTGYCEINIPEWMFDLDYPGHYLRRIKNVTMTIPCVVGPYTGVHCRLTLLSSMTRVDPRLSEPPATCCGDSKLSNRYTALPDDPRMVKQYGATEAIATSSGQNDSGLFELSFRDERYLPFEFAGAVSRWRIELPQENNQFDLDTLSDVVLHLNYMAREGGDVLRRAANELAQQHLPDSGWRFFDVKHEFPDMWHRFQSFCADGGSPRQLGLRLGRNMFAFLPGHRELYINRLELFFEAPGAEPSTHQVVKFQVSHKLGHMKQEQCECEIQDIYCVASAEWPGLYHGVLDVRLGPLSQSGDCDLGTFRFLPDTAVVSRAFLFCGYEVT